MGGTHPRLVSRQRRPNSHPRALSRIIRQHGDPAGRGAAGLKASASEARSGPANAGAERAWQSGDGRRSETSATAANAILAAVSPIPEIGAVSSGRIGILRCASSHPSRRAFRALLWMGDWRSRRVFGDRAIRSSLRRYILTRRARKAMRGSADSRLIPGRMADRLSSDPKGVQGDFR